MATAWTDWSVPNSPIPERSDTGSSVVSSTKGRGKGETGNGRINTDASSPVAKGKGRSASDVIDKDVKVLVSNFADWARGVDAQMRTAYKIPTDHTICQSLKAVNKLVETRLKAGKPLTDKRAGLLTDAMLLEAMALCDPEWHEHLDVLSDARKQSNLKKSSLLGFLRCKQCFQSEFSILEIGKVGYETRVVRAIGAVLEKAGFVPFEGPRPMNYRSKRLNEHVKGLLSDSRAGSDRS